MKKILFAFAVIAACLSAREAKAQHRGFYLYTGDAFISSGMTIDHNFEEQTNSYLTGSSSNKVKGDGYSLYSSNEKYISLGAGYRSVGGFGLEVGVLSDVSYSSFRKLDGDKDEGNAYVEALMAGLYQSMAINDNLNLIVSLSYRHLIIQGCSYHDMLLEPLCLEYMTRNKHWGFRLSVLSFEALTRTAKEESLEQIPGDSFNNSLGAITFGMDLNSFPIKVCYYF